MLLTLKRGRNCIDVKRQIETDKGLSKWIESSVSLIKDAHDNTIGAVEVFRDLSEIRELETRLRKADKLAAIGAMSACIAHEIRNPLNGIEGFSALLARDFSDSDPRKKLVKNIIQGTKNLNKTVTELLVFARPLKLSISDCRISEILNKTLFFVAGGHEAKGHLRHPHYQGLHPGRRLRQDTVRRGEVAAGIFEFVHECRAIHDAGRRFNGVHGKDGRPQLRGRPDRHKRYGGRG